LAAGAGAGAGAGAASFTMNSRCSSAKFRALDSADFLRAGCIQQNPRGGKKFCSTTRPKGNLQPEEAIFGDFSAFFKRR
jgi:hypothetical protein